MQHLVGDKIVILVIDELLSVSKVAHRSCSELRTSGERDISMLVVLAGDEGAALGDGFSDQTHDVVARSAQGGERL